MRRSICLSEPHFILAGEIGTWKFSYSSATPLPKGTRLKFADPVSTGRGNEWEIPQTNVKEKSNCIWAELPGGKVLAAKEVEGTFPTVPHFEFTLPQELKAGDTITIFIGSSATSAEERKKKGNRSQTFVQRRRPFHLYIDPKGKGDYKEPEIFSIDVRGNVLHNIRIISPSLVAKNKRFDVIVRFEDSFGNLTNNAPEGTLIELSYEHLRDNLSWKLFVPETGFINIPNLYFNETGIFKIQLLNANTKEKFYSSPIQCFAEAEKSIFWGLLHGESEKHDATDNIEACLRHFRDEQALSFYAVSPFESQEEMSNDQWKLLSSQVTELNEESRFATFLGFQWDGIDGEEGLRHIIYSKDNKPILRKKDIKTNILKKIYKGHNPKDMISIPSFTMGSGVSTNFSDFNPDFEKVVEIYNAWGSSECTAKEGNPRPIKSEGKNGIQETAKGSIREALNNNCRFGFVAGGLDDRGIYANLYSSDQVQYSPGLTAIYAIEQTREALYIAMSQRHTYATTGERIVLGYYIAGAMMGGELNTKAKPGLSFNRHIHGFIAGTSPLKEIAIIRNGKVFKTFSSENTHLEFAIDDSENIAKIALPSSDERPPFIYYYIRVTQEDGHIAWGSPIWIDILEDIGNGNKKKKK